MTDDRFVTPQRVVQIPEALLTDEEKPVLAGDVLPLRDGGRQVKVLDITPDRNGGILVQEIYRVTAEEISCRYQEPRVVVDMPPEAAKGLLAFYEKNFSSKDYGEETRAFARPIFDDIAGKMRDTLPPEDAEAEE